jgi:hypothetical protein
MKAEEMTLLEIGLLRHDVQAALPGGPYHEAPSLSMWSEYLPRAQIHGLDIASFAGVESDRITFTQADQADRTALEAAARKSRHPIRVVVDDGSHASQHQQISLAALFPHLASGGLYFIEDLNYQPPQWEAPGAVKTLTWLRSIIAGRPMASGFIDESEMAYLVANIADIQFYDSMDYASASLGQDSLAVIRKK